jgi:hypothetical protein
MKFGIYRLHEPLAPDALASIESACGRPIDLISVYRAWNRCDILDDRDWLEHLKSSCRDILLTWEPWRLAGGPKASEQPAFALKRILDGHYDDYIRDFGQLLSGFSRTVYLRPMHEMNGNWYPWCGPVSENSAELYIRTWRSLHHMVSKETGAGLRWVWSPYAASFPPNAHNAMERYFPGEDVVDWLGLDGYNWGAAPQGAGWQSFAQIFHAAYHTLAALSPKPMMIAETACNEHGGDKAAWIRQAFADVKTAYPRVRLLVWFDIDKECDWRMDSSPTTLSAFRQASNRQHSTRHAGAGATASPKI